tara:strand:- start:237 stop:1151 length:915 start_codon:yes stop_codon:yes gene_type:complete
MGLKSKESHPADLNNTFDKYIMDAIEKFLPQVPDDIQTLPEFLKIESDHCPYCNKPCEKFTMDEIIPCMYAGRYSLDGKNINMIKVCMPCNRSKGNKIDNKLRKWIKEGPVNGESRIPVENQDKIIAWLEINNRYLRSDNPIILSRIEEMHSENKIFIEKQKEKAKIPCISYPSPLELLNEYGTSDEEEEDEEDEVGEEVEVEVEAVPINLCRNLDRCIKDGQKIRHSINDDIWVGIYDTSKKCIICNGILYKGRRSPLNDFATAHYKEKKPCRTSQCNAWNECEYEINGEWKSMFNLPDLVNQ